MTSQGYTSVVEKLGDPGSLVLPRSSLKPLRSIVRGDLTDTPARRATSFMVARDSPSGRLRTGPHPFVEPLSRP